MGTVEKGGLKMLMKLPSKGRSIDDDESDEDSGELQNGRTTGIIDENVIKNLKTFLKVFLECNFHAFHDPKDRK